LEDIVKLKIDAVVVKVIGLMDEVKVVLFELEINQTGSYSSLYQRLRPCGTAYLDSVAESTDETIV
jgi:hypothetical protein